MYTDDEESYVPAVIDESKSAKKTRDVEVTVM